MTQTFERPRNPASPSRPHARAGLLCTCTCACAGLLTLGCGGETGTGSLTALIEAEDVITDGIEAGQGPENIRDGWSVSFSRYIAVVGALDLHRSSNASVDAEAPDSFAVDLVQVPAAGLALWQLGQIMEPVWGRVTFLAVLLGSGIAGSAASWIMNAPVPTVGLSGGIFGLATFLFALRRHHAVAAAIATTRFRNSLIAWFLACLVLTFTGTFNISNSGHAIGALTGWLIGRAHVAWRGRLDALVAAGLVVVAVLAASRLTFGSFDTAGGGKVSRSALRQLYLHSHEEPKPE